MTRTLFTLLALFVVGKALCVAEEAEEMGETVVVGTILEVTYSREDTSSGLKVTAVGQVPTGGYQNVLLTRVRYVKPPQDGIQDYILTAVKPGGIVTQVLSEVTATNEWKSCSKDAPWLKGIRIHGVGEGVKVVMFQQEKK